MARAKRNILMDQGAKNLFDILERSTERHPDSCALIFGARHITYATLLRQTRQFAGALSRLGVDEHDRVALWLPNCPEFTVAFFATLALNATVVPVNTMLKQDEAKFIIDDSKSKILIFSIDKIAESEMILTRVDSLLSVISLPAPHSKTIAYDFYTLLKGSPEHPKSCPAAQNDLAEIIYTSGTTGKPKGACLTHKNLLSNIADCAEVIRFSQKDTIICVLPLFHSFASTVCMLLPLYHGARIVIMRAVRPFKRIIRAIIKHRVTVFVGVPSFYSILSETKFPPFVLFLGIFLNPIRLCISGAAALPVPVWRKFERRFRRPLLEGYGLTEASPVVSLNPLSGIRKPGSIGLPLPSVKVKIVDAHERELATGEIGELLVQGANVMREYYNLPLESAQTLKNNWLYTGDLAKIDADGFIYIMGRIKEMVNVRGLNVYPKEIEDILFKHPAVKEAAVVGANHAKRGEVPIAFVVTRSPASEQELIRYLRHAIASYKVPFKVFFKETLPKNATGKIVKTELQREARELLNKTYATHTYSE
ncbi:MAG: long-chain fatty acid--CoA ligase [Candidatus Omnitrophota bacterium]|nr:long-chain fatty acid--CoA ligase [Candidatus Omnitrophota bacterium]